MRFYDPTGARYGIPTYPYLLAPDGYATRRHFAPAACALADNRSPLNSCGARAALVGCASPTSTASTSPDRSGR